MRQTYAVIKPSIIGDNLTKIKSHLEPNVQVMCIVKADAYGHGAKPVSDVLQKAGADAFGVATIDEGIELRQNGITKPILVLGAVSAQDLEKAIASRISLTVWYQGQLEEIKRVCQKLHTTAPIHLKIDTGMARLGVRNEDDLIALLHTIRTTKELFLEGVFTHFATADEDNSSYFQMQLERFQKAVAIVHAAGLSPVIHAGNSAVTLHYPQYHFDMVRPGYALYGYDPGPGDIGYLKPAMQWISQIVNLKWVSPDEGVSYGVTYRTASDTLIATVPVGYADGYRRAIGNCGYVLVKGKKAPVIGRVCMDQMMIDVTGISGISIHDEVVLLGEQGSETITANEMASWQDTIGYEVLCVVGKRVPRIYE